MGKDLSMIFTMVEFLQELNSPADSLEGEIPEDPSRVLPQPSATRRVPNDKLVSGEAPSPVLPPPLKITVQLSAHRSGFPHLRMFGRC